MKQDEKEKLVRILNCRGMYGIHDNLDKAIGFVTGFVAANESLFHKNFREWFIENYSHSSSPFSWDVLVEGHLNEVDDDQEMKVNKFVQILFDFIEYES